MVCHVDVILTWHVPWSVQLNVKYPFGSPLWLEVNSGLFTSSSTYQNFEATFCISGLCSQGTREIIKRGVSPEGILCIEALAL